MSGMTAKLLLQGLFATESNLALIACRQIVYVGCVWVSVARNLLVFVD